MPSTLRIFGTVAGCAALTAATLVVSAGPSVSAPAPAVTGLTPTHGVIGTTVKIAESGFASGESVDVTIGAGSTTGKVVGAPSGSVTVKVPVGSTTSKVTVTDHVTTTVTATSAGKFTVDPTPRPTKAKLAVSHSSVTYPGKVTMTATVTSAGHAVRGLAVRLQQRALGAKTWHHFGATPTRVTSGSGQVHWSIAPSIRAAYRTVSSQQTLSGTRTYAAAASNARRVGVRPALRLSLPSTSDVLVTARATGTLTPHLTGRVKLERRANHHWHVIASPRVHHGSFSAGIPMSTPGTEKFRVVRGTDGRHLGASSAVVTTNVVAPTLRLGSSGAVVEALQKRLRKLHYDVGSSDGNYGWDAVHAVTAFQKVQGLSKDGVAGPSVFAKLADPKRIHLKHKIKSGVAVEVNLEKQVLLISKKGKLWRILDTSTAGGYLFTGSNGQTERAVTPRGHFHVVYKINGIDHARLGTLYRPSFFNYNGYAIHGEGNGNDGSNVPPYPNSHGCVRITDNAADRYYDLLAVGTSVWIY
jgi:peptidoglycan hydrolase-like protein with peptidoglycan-binding domain